AGLVSLPLVAGAALATETGTSSLPSAAREGDRAAVRSLLDSHANVNVPEDDGTTALIWAAYRNDVEMADLLLRAGADVKVAAELARHGADVQGRSKNGFTAISFAAQQGDADSIRTLLEAGANVNDVAPQSGLTPLLIASAMGRTKAAALLLDKGADPDAVA